MSAELLSVTASKQAALIVAHQLEDTQWRKQLPRV